MEDCKKCMYYKDCSGIWKSYYDVAGNCEFKPEKRGSVGWLGQDDPSTLLIILTRKCNLNCSHCYVDKTSDNKELSYNELKKGIDIFLDSTIDDEINIVFFGGEPLLRFDIIKKVTYYIKSRKDHIINILLNTNGLLLSSEISSFIWDNGISITIGINEKAGNYDPFKMLKTIHRYQAVFSCTYSRCYLLMNLKIY